MSELLYHISIDIEKLLDEDYDDVIDAITNLAREVNILSDNMYEDEIVYERPAGRVDFKFSLT